MNGLTLIVENFVFKKLSVAYLHKKVNEAKLLEHALSFDNFFCNHQVDRYPLL